MIRFAPIFCLIGLLFGAATVVPASPAHADDLPPQGTERVAASVNQEAITIHDLDARVRLGLLAANLPDTAENRQQLAREVLRRLIDERLELQEATRLKINVTETEIDNGVTDLERQNHMEKGQLIALLERNGIDPQTIRDQTHAEIAWLHAVREQLLPSVHIGEEEITSRLRQMSEGVNKVAFLAADIYLPVEDPRRDGEVKELADRLVDQLKKGAPFSSLARQFSRSGAATGGDLGWISRGMIDDTLFDVLAKLEPNHASVPVRTRDGYHILLLRDRHSVGAVLSNEPTFDLAQIDLTMLPSATEAERQNSVAKFRNLVAKDGSCDAYEKHAGATATAHYSRVGLVRPSETPAEIESLIVKLRKGEMSEPFKLENTTRFFVVCERTEATGGLPSREEVRRRIENERLELLAQRYLRDLRRAAFVEVRI
jgi:peptidyl-prolyl cis-trans isomerase SurA